MSLLALDDFLGSNSGDKYKILEEPDAIMAAKFINRQKVNYVVIIFAHCMVEYEGRAKSTLSKGDRLIIIKPDGTLLIHEDRKKQPVNWQPPGSRIRALIKDEKLYIYSSRETPREKVLIKIETVYFITSARVEKGEFILKGSERDFVDLVEKNPNMIEEGLHITRREAPTPYGNIDLIGNDKNNNLVIMEFKRGTATVSSALQLLRYITYYRKFVKEKIRGIIVAPDITSDALILLKSSGLEFKKLDLKKLLKEK